ncbi:hypothetical protein [Neobacillus notoginsengisoli]|nr:hypothetical protein [Neobacillus notoginsengisoli]
MLFFTFSVILTGCNFFEEQKAKSIIKDYYQAIIDEEYEKAFEQVHLYDVDSKTGDGHFTDGTTLSYEEAKVFYLEKINILKEQNYKLEDFKIEEVEYEDGHSFWHHIKLMVDQDGQKFEWNEVAEIYEGKLVIGEKDDPNAIYRDGRMKFEIEELKGN